MKRRLPAAVVQSIPGQRDRFATSYGLPWSECRCFKKVTVERAVTVIVIDHETVRQRAVGTVHRVHHAIADGYNFRASGAAKVDPEVQSLTKNVGRISSVVGFLSVAVELVEQPGVWTAGRREG